MSEQNDVSDYDKVMEQARQIFVQRQAQYGGSWKQYGWRGCLYNVRRKAERAWRLLWHHEPVLVDVTKFGDEGPPQKLPGEWPDYDDLLDVINYCAMAVIAIREGNRDGTFWTGI